MKTTFRGKAGIVAPSGYDSGRWDWVAFDLEDVIGTSFMEADKDGASYFRWFVNLKDFRQLEVTDTTFHQILDAKQELCHAT